MSKEIDWSKAPEGATHWVGGNEPWHKHIGDTSWYWQESQQKWYQLRICASDVEDEYRETIVKKPEQSWTGQGLPPVGTVCEFYSEEDEEWLEGKIIAHGVDEGRKWAIMQCDDAVWMGEDHEFRVKRTSEQIAAEERESAIKEIASMIGRGTFSEDAARIYDAGYRKTEAGK